MIFDRKPRMLLNGTHFTGANFRKRRKHEFDQGDGGTNCDDGGDGRGSGRKRLRAGGKGACEGLQSTRAGNLRVQKGGGERAGARARNFLLQMLVLPQRIRAGDPAAQGPLSEAQPAIGRERERRRSEGENSQRRRRHGGIQVHLERCGFERPRELFAGEMLLGFRYTPAQSALSDALTRSKPWSLASGAVAGWVCRPHCWLLSSCSRTPHTRRPQRNCSAARMASSNPQMASCSKGSWSS